MKYFIAAAAVLMLSGSTAFAVVGGPLFCVGLQNTSMTVEAAKVNVDITSPGVSDQKTEAISDRVMLTARYGVWPGVDISASVGAANLRFGNLTSGYSDFSANWALAYGAGIRAGVPAKPQLFQVIGAVNYTGFRPKGATTNGVKNIDSKYMWHEVSPAVAVGAHFGAFVPYIGATKPFLFGKRDVTVALNGQVFPSAGGASDYSDKDQPFRGILGLEWRLPEGYSIGAEAAATTEGVWTMTISLTQLMR
jgi:hypothetical protein